MLLNATELSSVHSSHACTQTFNVNFVTPLTSYVHDCVALEVVFSHAFGGLMCVNVKF